jgi:hypothetical protein
MARYDIPLENIIMKMENHIGRCCPTAAMVCDVYEYVEDFVEAAMQLSTRAEMQLGRFKDYLLDLGAPSDYAYDAVEEIIGLFESTILRCLGERAMYDRYHFRLDLEDHTLTVYHK